MRISDWSSDVCSSDLIFSRDLLAGRTSTALRGLYSTDDALDLLLRGSGLFAERSPRGTILIRRPDTKTRLHRTSVIQVAPSSPTVAVPTAAKIGREHIRTPVTNAHLV